MAVRSLNTAATGMRAMQTHVDVLANNLANVQTTGYKRDRAEFADLLYQDVRRAGMQTPVDSRTPTGIQIGNGVQVVTVSKEFEQGAPMQTGHDYDMCITGPGFFQVEIPGGQIAYTRNGAFKRDSNGDIVTAEGYKLEPNITVPTDVIRVEISQSGEVNGFVANDTTAQNLGQIELAFIPNPQGLEAIGDNLYVADPLATGPIQTGAPATQPLGQVRARFLEASNVDVVKSMVDLIKAQRAYEFNATSIRSSDSMLQQTASLIR